MEVIQDIKLDISDRGQYVVVSVKQADSGRKLSITMIDGNTEIEVPNTATASIRVLKEDGTSVDDTCTVSNGKVIATLTSQITAVEGYARADVSVASSGSIVSTATFLIKVSPVPLGTQIVSENEFTQLSDLIASASQYQTAIGNLQEGKQNKIAFGICETDNITAEKYIDIEDFEFADGQYIAILFTYGNTASNPTMLVKSTLGIFPIYWQGQTARCPMPTNSMVLFRATVINNTNYYAVVGTLPSLLASNNVVVTNVYGNFEASPITQSQLMFLTGLTGNIQEQLTGLDYETITDAEINAL